MDNSNELSFQVQKETEKLNALFEKASSLGLEVDVRVIFKGDASPCKIVALVK